jgi:hypothetical protein
MPHVHAILDPLDPSLFHTDVTCVDLWVLAARVEAASGVPVTDPEALVDQAHADGLLLVEPTAPAGAVEGLRCCRGCRPGSATDLLPLAA